MRARPGVPTGSLTLGAAPLGLGGDRDGTVYTPPSYSRDQAIGLLVLLHGAGQRAAPFVDAVSSLADQHGIVILAPDARTATWDVISAGQFGPDVDFLDDALARVFDRATIDPARIGITGFSDGGTYALSLGLINGDLFRKVAGLSPGYFVADDRIGKPPVLLTHGVNDVILPINQASRKIQTQLRDLGYTVTLIEYDGGHQLPPEIATQAFDWLGG